jgi:hypothetical protein
MKNCEQILIKKTIFRENSEKLEIELETKNKRIIYYILVEFPSYNGMFV